MADVLISGPAGANKTAEARRLLEAYPGPAVALDFQSIYAALLLLERMADGRYPQLGSRNTNSPIHWWNTYVGRHSRRPGIGSLRLSGPTPIATLSAAPNFWACSSQGRPNG